MRISDELMELIYTSTKQSHHGVQMIARERLLSLIERLRIAELALEYATTPGRLNVTADCHMDEAERELIAEGKVRVQA